METKHTRNIFRQIAAMLRLTPDSKIGSFYPVVVRRRQIETKSKTRDGRTEKFDSSDYLEINKARLEHLATLELPIRGKKVLDVGCGVGHLSQFFVERECKVVCLDGRAENIASLQSRYPNLEAHVADAETDPLTQFGSFNIVFSYGLLYHLENPIAGLRNMASACDEMLLLETMICDHELPILKIEDESLAFTQALRGLGVRPSPSFLALALSRIGFPYVYTVREPPNYKDFRFRWKYNHDSSRDGHPLRCIFVASHVELRNPGLVSLLKG